MRKLGLVLAAAAIVTFAGSAWASHEGDPLDVNGPHYNLNIIGVEHGKSADLVGGNAHRIFVQLGKKNDGVRSYIWLLPSDDFRVCDGNGTSTDDGAYDCDGNLIQNAGATFELPCNWNITDDQEALIECDRDLVNDGYVANYAVYARPLGSPKYNPYATVTTCATVQGEDICSTENTVQTRHKGRSLWTNVTDELTSIVVEYCFGGAGVLATCVEDGGMIKTTRIALFSGDTEDWLWQYDNNGLRLLQLRFYPVPVI